MTIREYQSLVDSLETAPQRGVDESVYNPYFSPCSRGLVSSCALGVPGSAPTKLGQDREMYWRHGRG